MRLGGTWLLGASVTTVQVHDDGRVPESQGPEAGWPGAQGEGQSAMLFPSGGRREGAAHWGELSGVRMAPKCPIADARLGRHSAGEAQ